MDWLDRIRSDKVSGAAALAIEAARGLIEAGAEDLAATARALVEAQPAMAPLFHLANAALLAGPDRLEETCRRFIDRLGRAEEAIAEAAAGLIADGALVLTHSRSSAVLAALRRAHAQGRRFEAVCTESRPMCEGVTLARELGAAGIPARLIADAAVSLAVPEARLVLVGADSVTTRGVVNKIGTSLIALAARESGVPMYALCSTEKLLPAAYHPPPERDPRESYFDLTPAGRLAAIVTEEGLLRPSELEPRLNSLRVHPALRVGRP